MPGRPRRLMTALVPALAAIFVAGCQNDLSTGPRIATLAQASGDDQVGFTDSVLVLPLVVKVTDQTGAPISGVQILWSVTSGGGRVSPSQSVTDAAGLAQTTHRLGSLPGTQSVSAALPGGPPTVFVATALIPPPPPEPDPVIRFVSINVGERHTCGLSSEDVNFCWGYNGEGQLGIGKPPAGAGTTFALPQAVQTEGAFSWRQAVASRFHTCALTQAGVAWCWGTNLDGRLGDNTVEPRDKPTQVVTSTTFSTINPGRVHTCGLSLTGRAFCWGYTRDGGIGIPVDSIRGDALTIPVEVDTLGRNYRSLATGRSHNCAVTTAGAAWCWGDNQQGQLGDSSTTRRFLPVAVTGGLAFDSITAGGRHSCGLTATLTAFCWGDNALGQLGSGTGSSLQPVPVGGGINFVQISAGVDYTCGLNPSGFAFCWGDNTFGQLGTNNRTATGTPTAVGGGLTFRSINAGTGTTCGMTTGGVAYCWGDNKYGQIGDGTQTDRLLPVKVAFQP